MKKSRRVRPSATLVARATLTAVTGGAPTGGRVKADVISEPAGPDNIVH